MMEARNRSTHGRNVCNGGSGFEDYDYVVLIRTYSIPSPRCAGLRQK
jgi:hypothetical protein